jgi:hypothetical protein
MVLQKVSASSRGGEEEESSRQVNSIYSNASINQEPWSIKMAEGCLRQPTNKPTTKAPLKQTANQSKKNTPVPNPNPMSRPVPANEPVVTSSSLHRLALKELKLSCSFQVTVDGNQAYTTAFTLDLNDSDRVYLRLVS